MNKVYKYRLGRNIIWISALYIIAFVGLAVALALVYEGGYISAWFISLIVAILALMLLSTPRKITLAEDGVEIHCVSDYTFIEYGDIASVRKVENKSMSLCLPLFGAIGFFGHYGRFLNLGSMEIVHIYASRWGKFVEITDIDNEKYYISCEDADDFIRQIEGVIRPLDTRENL